MVVQRDDLGPVGCVERIGGAVHRLDRGLDLEGARPAATDAGADDRMPFLDHHAIPPGPVLIAQQDQAPVVRAGGCPRLAQQHQRQQARRLRLVGHQLDERASEPDRLGP